MSWTLEYIEKLKTSGLIKGYQVINAKKEREKPTLKKQPKISLEKLFIEAHLRTVWGKNLHLEVKFAEDRRFRFDYANPVLKIAVEYEGIFSKKSRHTTQSGYSKDTEKYNLAASLEWKVYRYTSKTYKNIIKEIKKQGYSQPQII